MKKRRKLITIIIVVVFLISAPSVMMWRRATEQSRARIEREHGVILPQSAGNFQCLGDAWRGFLDRGASSIFVMKREELSMFISQLPVDPPPYQTFIPGNDIYQPVKRPWKQEATPENTYGSSSPVGDWLHVEIYSLDASSIGVWLYTDWN